MSQSHDPARLSRLEVLGAWLHLWTPHRDAVVPPVPWRRIGLWTAGAVVVLGLAAAIIVPKVDTAKREGAARDARELAALRATRRAEIEREQRPHTGALPTPSRSVAARERLFAKAQADVLADARARAAARQLQGPIRGISCIPYPPGGTTPQHAESDPAVGAGAWSCTAVTDYIKKTDVNAAGMLGYPFRLKVDFKRFSYVWCKENPVAGEQAMPDPRSVVNLPPVCRV